MALLPPPGSHIHLIGIGGAGMSAIARVLLGQGYRVTGSDRIASDLAAALVAEGAAVVVGHDAVNVAGAQAVLVTSAAAADHVEVQAAREAGIPVYKRSEIVGDLTRGKKVIAVAGTAGKTTTTAMIAHLLISLGRDPSYIVGGTLPMTGLNGRAGAGGEFVIEADEYDHMFLGLSPDVAVVTNLVWDHPDFFPSPQVMENSFVQFSERITPAGQLIVCGDDPGALRLARSFAERRGGQRVSAYGGDSPAAGSFNSRALIENLRVVEGSPTFDYVPTGAVRTTIRLSVPGRHNALNAMAALTAVRTALDDRLDMSRAAAALASFGGAGRRFEIMGEREGVIVVDDYAHHPLKIRAALEAARSRYPQHALWAVWQPHTFSRTQALWDDFIDCFSDADHVLVTPIYAARESPISGVDGAGMAEAIARRHPDARHVVSFDQASALLLREARSPAVIMILSAGDAPRIGWMFLGT
ncbi:MAG: UDP-N-acetylmuramate--L-alanine ligase [Anaerolineae bacterium]|nr:UDP-N-acetylmuramate--L-alanine ligase [Anaerolineae bacterium]